MLFCDPAEVNTVWAIVARGTANNELGIASKVAPDDGDERKPRLICIYTKDFNDLDDVSRVVQKMRDLKLVETRQAIYYKCGMFPSETIFASTKHICQMHTHTWVLVRITLMASKPPCTVQVIC